MEEIINKAITQESLQPQRIEKGTKPYLSVLDLEERIQKKDAYNIALTGPYGSGKSSILITLKEDFPDHHYLDISLAKLRPLKEMTTEETHNEESEENTEKDSDDNAIKPIEKDKKEEKPTKHNIDRLIEYSILQQLIYREKQETLPNSRLKRIYQLPAPKICKITIAVILAVFAIIVVFEPTFVKVEWLCQLLSKKWINIVGDILGIVYLIWFAYKAIYKIVPAVSNSRLNKVNLKDGEIEIVKNTSIFNKHLDEILYFFEQTDYDVVLLEDLDRFESTDIFLKLRELNFLLNESKLINRKIVFIYAVRDDMFQDEGRVKCFDYITTVIPVINRSNAKSQLKLELEKRGVNDLNDVCLSDIGFFLHDMRLLKNIANEYVQYRERLEKNISPHKLLAMIVYKNYFPEDFAKLHYCKGTVYDMIKLKERLVKVFLDKIDVEEKQTQELRARHEKDRHLKETELRRIYVEAYRDKLPNNPQEIKVGDNYHSFSEVAINGKLFDKLISSPNIEYRYIIPYSAGSYYPGRTQHGNASITFKDVENAVNSDVSYIERLEAIRAVVDGLDDNHSYEIRKEDIRTQTLSQIMNNINYSSDPHYIALKVPKLIEFLVKKGYIDENYYDYISLFYDNFIDASDWEFVLDLKLGKAHPFDFHINNVKACLEEIPGSAFRGSAILNIEMVDFLAEHISEEKHLLQLMVLLRTALRSGNYNFFSVYYQSGKQQGVVFEQLFSHHKNLWKVFDKNDDEKHSLKLIWFKYAENAQSCDESSKWLSTNFDFITDNMLDISDEQWIQLIQDGDYEFERLNEKSGEILDAIANSNAYTLTRHNVEILTARLLNMKVDSVSYRLVNDTEHKELINRVEDNLGQCLKSVFSAPEAEKENEGAIIGIIKSHQAAEDEKIGYLSAQQNKLDFMVVEQNDWTLALRCDVINPTWENIISYLNNKSDKRTDGYLTAFIEKHIDQLISTRLPQDNEGDLQMLFEQFVKSDVLTLDTYAKILNQFVSQQLIGVRTIEGERVLLLIEKGILPFNELNSNDLVAKYSGAVVVAYLLKNKRDFLTKIDTIHYTTDIAIGLMRSSLSYRDKARIITHFDKKILNKDLANEVIEVMMVQDTDLTVDFLYNVFSLSDQTDGKIIVLNNTLQKNNLNDDSISSFITTLSEKYKGIAEKGKKTEIPNNAQNLKLVKILENKGYISSYSESTDGIRVNTKLK